MSFNINTITGDPVYGMAGQQNIPIAPYNDLDQGGVEQGWERYFQGHSIGWTMRAQNTIRLSAGIYVLQLGVATVACNTSAGPITLTLPTFRGTSSAFVSQGALPGRFIPVQIVIKDSAGAANTNAITIQAAPGETISGLPFVQISSAYGTIWLQPDPVNGSCIAL